MEGFAKSFFFARLLEIPMNSIINFKELFSYADWIIFALALSCSGIAIYIGKKQASSQNFLETILMSRSLTLPFFVASLVTTWYGGIIAVSANSFEQGFLQFFSQGFFWYLAYLFFVFVLAPKINLQETLSLPHLVSKIFGHKTAKISAFLSFIDAIPIVYLTSLAILVQIIFGGNLYIISLALGFFIVCYSIYGGFRALMYVDIVQFVLINIGLLLVMVFSFYTYGNPFNLVLPPHYFTVSGTEGYLSLFSWALVALSVIIDPAFHHRIYAVGNLKTTQKSILICIFFWVFFDLSITFIGLYAKSLLPEIHPNESFLTYSLQVVPQGLRGFVLAGVLATILSAVDTHLFVAANTISEYFFNSFIKHKVKRHYFSLFFVAFLAASIGFFFKNQIIFIFKLKGALTTGCFLIPMLFGSFYPKIIPDHAFVKVFWMSVTAVIFSFILKFFNLHSLDDIYPALITSIFSLTYFFIKYKDHETIS